MHSPQFLLTHPQARLLSHARHSSLANMCTLIPHSTLSTSRRPALAPRARRSWEPGRAPSSLSVHGHPSPFSWHAQISKAAWLLEAGLLGSCFAPTQTWRQGPAGQKRFQAGEAQARERVRPAGFRVADWAGGLQELSSAVSTRRGGSRSGPRAQPGWSPGRPGRATRRLSQPRPQRLGFHRK